MMEKMISKVAVGKLYSDCVAQDIKKEIKAIREEITRMENSCITMEMKAIWNNSKEYAVLHAKLEVLTNIAWNMSLAHHIMWKEL